VILLQSSCNTTRPQTDIAAIIVNPDATSRRELQQVLSTALHDAAITVADDALTQSSELSVEAARHRSLDGQVPNGRDLGRPEMFALVLDGSQCVLIHRTTGLRWLLIDTECAAQ
jgi:hypothetical protein